MNIEVEKGDIMWVFVFDKDMERTKVTFKPMANNIEGQHGRQTLILIKEQGCIIKFPSCLRKNNVFILMVLILKDSRIRGNKTSHCNCEVNRGLIS